MVHEGGWRVGFARGRVKTITISKAFRFEGLTIPRGWRMDIPSFEIPLGDPALLRYSRNFQKFGASPSKGLEVSLQASIRVCEMAWIRLVKASVGYWAQEYENAFGDLLGYDATRIAAEFTPYTPKVWGQHGKASMKTLLTEMRRRVI